MAAKKKSRGPKITTYVLTVNEETGKVLQAHVENSRTGARKKVGVNASIVGVPTAVVFTKHRNPGDRGVPGIGGPITRLGLKNLHVMPINPLINPPTNPVNPAPTRLIKKMLK